MHNAFHIATAVTALRSLKTLAASKGDPVAADSFIRQKGWTDRAEIMQHMKGNVGGFESADVGGGQAFDFQASASAAAAIGRFPGVRRLPPRLSIMTPTGQLRAAVVAEGRAVPLLPVVYSRQQIAIRKIAAMLVASNDSMKDDLVEAALARDLLDACAAALDQAMFSSVIANSLTDGVTPIDSSVASVTELDAALKGAIDALTNSGGNLATSAWVMPSWLAAHLGLLRSSGQLAYPAIGANGGSIAGLPALSWNDTDGPDTDFGEIALIDGSLIGYSEGKANLRTSQDATIEMSTTPAGDSIAPTAASVVHVSMFDADASAILATLRAGAIVRRTGAVQLVSGITL